MIRHVSKHESTNKLSITENHTNFKFLQTIFPSRRSWKKLNEKERKIFTDTNKVNTRRLIKSIEIVKLQISKGSPAPDWYKNLMSFIYQIQADIENIMVTDFMISQPNIKGIKKETVIEKATKEQIIIYRPIALYEYRDKIICSLTAKYLINFFEPLFCKVNCSFAFRPRRADGTFPTHHDCVDKILEYKDINPNLWVAECDIQKFFDTVQHKHIQNVLDKLANDVYQQFGETLDIKAKKIFNLFLDSFNFQDNILNLDNNWFNANKLPFGKFKWVDQELNSIFGADYTKNYSIGVPQGNAISCFIANLILHDVDIAVKDFDKSLFYIRYCDDMILMHFDEQKCKDALSIYMDKIRENFLLYHEPEKFMNYKEQKMGRSFWKKKSKLPFRWDDINKNENNVPWVSFVGYQIDYHKRVRVRKATLKKETKKQIFETQKVIKALGKVHRNKMIGNQHARLSKKQTVFRLQQRLISMSVGRVNIYNHRSPLDQGFCWSNGFQKLGNNSISRKQLRYLDKRRQIQIARLDRELKSITNHTNNTFFPEDKKHIKYGGAYSYYNYLKHK